VDRRGAASGHPAGPASSSGRVRRGQAVDSGDNTRVVGASTRAEPRRVGTVQEAACTLCEAFQALAHRTSVGSGPSDEVGIP